MKNYLDKAIEIRNNSEVHYNCAQAVLCTFAEEMGMTAEQAMALGANFGSGMRFGSVCGAITAGLMVLGIMGISDLGSARSFRDAMTADHEGFTDCADLLRLNASKGMGQKQHCDEMVYSAVHLIEQMI